MADLTYTATLDDKISPALAKIQTQTKKTTELFGRFQTALAGLAIGAAIQSALQFADAIVDISDASEIGVANVLGFGKAVSQLGGNTEKAQNAISKFGLTVGEAVNGGLSAQNSFRDLGITLNDLAKLDTQGLFDLTLKRLSELDDVTQRNRISSELFGKTLRGVDLKNLASSYQNLTAASAKYAEDVRRGAELQDKLGAAFSKLKLEILKALEPLINFINELKPEQIEKFVEAVVKIGGAAVAISTLASAFKGLGAVLGYTAALAVSLWGTFKLGLSGVATAGASLSRTWTIFTSQMGYAWRALVAAIGTGSIVAVFSSLGTTISVLATKRIPYLVAGLGAAILGFGRMIPLIGTVISVLALVNEGVKLAFNIDPIDWFLVKLGKAYEGFKNFIGLGSGKALTITPAAPDPRDGARGRGDPKEIAARKAYTEEQKRLNDAVAAEKAKQAEIRKELDLKISAIRQGTEEFRKGLADQVKAVELSGQLIGKSELQKEIMQATASITKEAADKTLELGKAMSQLKGVEKDELTPVYQAQIAAIEILRKSKILEIEEALKGNAMLKASEDLRLYGIKEQQQAQDDLLKIRKDLAQIGLGDSARQQMDVAAAADERAKAEIRALEASRGVPLIEEEKNRIFEISKQQLGAVAAATLQLSQAQEKYAQSQAAINFNLKSEYDLQDKVLGLQREIADVGLLGIEKSYRDIIRATEDSARAAIRAEEDRRSAIAGTRVMLDPSESKAYYDNAKKGSEELIKSQKKLYDSSRTFSTGWSNAFKRYVEDATNAAARAERMFAKFTQGLEDLIVDFAKTGKFEWQSFVDSMLEELLRSQIKETMAGLGSALGFGDLFGGAGSANARGSSANNPMYVIDVAGGNGGGLIGSLTSGNNSMMSGGGIGGGIGSSVIGGLGDIISTAGSWLNENLFGGFFANGGSIPAGKVGIVGENGPEFAAGPGTIMPMGGGGSSVTYNINAVDARSFQQLLAQDPGFVHAVVQQGARGIPQRR